MEEKMAACYDEEAKATGWHGPEVLFGMTYGFIEAGGWVLDIGIGTGLSSELFRRAGFTVYMDREKSKELPARAYIMRKCDSPPET